MFLRVRPLAQQGDEESVTILDDQTVEFKSAKQVANFTVPEHTSGDRYTFNHVFDTTTSQKEIYDKTSRPHVLNMFEGHDSLLFAYGVTNAGKTYTMMGKLNYSGKADEGDGTPTMLKKTTIQKKKSVSMKRNFSDGIIPRVLEEIFDIIEEKQLDCDNPHEQYIVSLSFFELYNEKVYDLLYEAEENEMRESVSVSFLAGDSNNRRRKNLKIGEDKGRAFVKDLIVQEVDSAAQGREVLMRGTTNRQVGQTNLNADSSRSHAVFSVTLQRKNVALGTLVDVAKMSIVDLAGAERAGKTKVVGDRLKEAGGINKSLLVLGRCLHAIQYNQRNADNPSKRQPVPIRESEITKLFRNELQGDAAVTMIVNVSSAMSDSDETANVMKYSAVAKDIKTQSRVDTYRKTTITTPQPFVNPRILATPASIKRGPKPSTSKKISVLDENIWSRNASTTNTTNTVSEEEVEALREQVRQLQEEVSTRFAPVNRIEVERDIRAEVAQKMQEQEEERENAMREQIEQEKLAFEERLNRVKKMMQKQIDRCQAETEQSIQLEEEWQARAQAESARVEILQQEVQRLEEALESAMREKYSGVVTDADHQSEVADLKAIHNRLMKEQLETEENKRLDLELTHRRAHLDHIRETDMLKDQLAKYAVFERELKKLEERFKTLQAENEQLKVTHAEAIQKEKSKALTLEKRLREEFAEERARLIRELSEKYRGEFDSKHLNTRQHAEIEIESLKAHLKQEQRDNQLLAAKIKELTKEVPVLTSTPKRLAKPLTPTAQEASPMSSVTPVAGSPEPQKTFFKSPFKNSSPVVEKLKKGTKRTSESLSESVDTEEANAEEPPKKRRLINRKKKNNSVETDEQDTSSKDTESKSEEEKPKRGRPATKSKVKLASKNAHDVFDFEGDDEPAEEEEEEPPKKKRGRPAKKDAKKPSKASKIVKGVRKLMSRKKKDESEEEEEDEEAIVVDVEVDEEEEEEERPKRTTRASRKK